MTKSCDKPTLDAPAGLSSFSTCIYAVQLRRSLYREQENMEFIQSFLKDMQRMIADAISLFPP